MERMYDAMNQCYHSTSGNVLEIDVQLWYNSCDSKNKKNKKKTEAMFNDGCCYFYYGFGVIEHNVPQ